MKSFSLNFIKNIYNFDKTVILIWLSKTDLLPVI